jgi:hypothetical protein
MSYRPHMATKVRSEKLMAAHDNYPCTMRISGLIEGHRCSSQATVVGVHPERLGTGGVIGKGTSTKASDLYCMAGCFNCHNLVSGVDPRIDLIIQKHPIIFMQRMVSALHETLALHIDAKVLIVPDATFL